MVEKLVGGATMAFEDVVASVRKAARRAVDTAIARGDHGGHA